MDWEREYKAPTLESLQDRIYILERQLATYHEWFEEAEEQRHLFQLKATWGILTGAGFIAAMWGTDRLVSWLKLDGVIAWIVSAAVFITLFLLSAWWVERGLKDDEKKLHRLPKWGSDEFRGNVRY